MTQSKFWRLKYTKSTPRLEISSRDRLWHRWRCRDRAATSCTAANDYVFPLMTVALVACLRNSPGFRLSLGPPHHEGTRRTAGGPGRPTKAILIDHPSSGAPRPSTAACGGQAQSQVSVPGWCGGPTARPRPAGLKVPGAVHRTDRPADVRHRRDGRQGLPRRQRRHVLQGRLALDASKHHQHHDQHEWNATAAADTDPASSTTTTTRTAAGCFDDEPVHGDVAQPKPHDPVVGIQAQLLQRTEERRRRSTRRAAGSWWPGRPRRRSCRRRRRAPALAPACRTRSGRRMRGRVTLN
jgi:hypothetical protein